MDLFSNLKICKSCKIPKSLSDFCKHKTSKDGLYYICRKCSAVVSKKYAETHKEENNIRKRKSYCKHRESRIKRTGIYYRANKEKVKEQKLKKYGLTLDEFKKMIELQENKCKICRKDFSKKILTNVDHCHKIGKVRGLLCSACNTSLSIIKENITTLKNMIKYIKESLPLQHKIKL